MARRIGLRMSAMMIAATAMIPTIMKIRETGGVPCPFQDRASVNQLMSDASQRAMGLGTLAYSE